MWIVCLFLLLCSGCFLADALDNECQRNLKAFFHVSFSDIAHSDAEVIYWKLIKVDEDTSTSITLNEGTANDACGLCVDSGSYVFIVQSGNETGLAGGTCEVFIDGTSQGTCDAFTIATSFDFTVTVDLTRAPTVSPLICPFNFKQLDVIIELDDKPEEALATLVDMSDGTVIASANGGFSVCIDLIGNYSINLIDCGGDGYCCENGYGNYAFLFDESVLLDTGGKFNFYKGFYLTEEFLSDYLITFPSAEPSLAPSSAPSATPTTFAFESIEIVVTPTVIGEGVSASFQIAAITRLNFDAYIVVEALSNDFKTKYGNGSIFAPDETTCAVVTVQLFQPIPTTETTIKIRALVVPVDAFESDEATSVFLQRQSDVDTASSGASFVYRVSEPLDPNFACFAPPTIAPSSEPSLAPSSSPSAAPVADPIPPPTTAPTASFQFPVVEISLFPSNIPIGNSTFDVAVFVQQNDPGIILVDLLDDSYSPLYGSGHINATNGESCQIITVTTTTAVPSSSSGLRLRAALIPLNVWDVNPSFSGQIASDQVSTSIGTLDYPGDFTVPLPDFVCYTLISPTSSPTLLPPP